MLDGATHEPIAGAVVLANNLERAAVPADRAVTDTGGHFRIDGLEAGRYAPYASTEGGYGQVEHSVQLGLGQTVDGLTIATYPMATVDGRVFDGNGEVAIFPGDLPKNTDVLFKPDAPSTDVRFVRFRPPKLERTAEGLTLSLPHIRLDRALEFLLGDKLA